ncbi:MAG: response regulator, partial [Deltaproteobacteria bacterium]|nr:response regulator [Deltaproteobacteria bacterium]
MMLKLALEDHHHKVLTALSGEEALKMFWEQPVDLVLCDLAMPGMNGWEVGQSIGRLCEQKSAPRPTFILFTAWGDQAADKEKMAESGVDAIIEKPVEIPALLGLVRTISNQRGLAR